MPCSFWKGEHTKTTCAWWPSCFAPKSLQGRPKWVWRSFGSPKRLEESAKVVSNKYLTNAIDKARKEVVEGKDFVQALTKTQIFPDIFIQLIWSGYRSGNLVKMFKKVSDFMKSEIESKRSVLLSLLEPVITIFMGGFILLIVLAILIPIMQMKLHG